ncbi:MAG: glycosyltransferase family 2 protein [Ferruginibacter sp.]|nr:glycosyltransferase family 2 protein [Ferruginibacter sp.]
MDLSIIVVNYKSPGLVLDCIRSIYAETKLISFEIIVVDNDSKDESEEIITTAFPAITWLQMGYNSGFARANNAGIEKSTGDFILLLNADTIVLNRAIEQSLFLLKKYPRAVGCGVQLLNTDGSTQISGAHFIRGGMNTLLPLPYLGRFIRYLGYRFKATIPSVQTVTHTLSVDWLVGAYILVRKNILSQTGLLDPDFFMYAEEIEWCARLRKQGDLLLFAEPQVRHIGGGTSGDYYETAENENGKNLWNKKGRQIIVSTMVRIRKQFGIGWYLVIIGTYLLEVPIFYTCLIFDKILNGNKTKYSWQNAVNYAVNMGVLLRYFVKILVNKPYFYKVA